jgi:hypothetical protein
VAERKIASYDLGQASGTPPLIPSAAGAFDGCLAYEAQPDASARTFYLVAPVQAAFKADGARDYRILAFALPDVHLVKSVPAGSNLTEPPHLDVSPDGVPRTVPASEWRPPTDIDLSAYAHTGEKLGNQILESSGNRALLRIFAADPKELKLAVADTKSKTVATLETAVSTTARNAHLSPDGAVVLIEETEAGGQPKKTGRLVLFDGNTGKELRQISYPAARDQYFLAISPTGKAVYHSGEAYSFLNLQREFPDRPVRHAFDSSFPSCFLADR